VVLTVSHSFIASANAIRLARAEPVFVEIDPETLNMDPKTLAATIDQDFEHREEGLFFGEVERIAVGESPLSACRQPLGRLAAILVVHQIGRPAPMAALLHIAEQAGVPVIEDAACAIGSEITVDGGDSWQPVGSPLGAAACFSFHPRKVITTGEGGMITTADAAIHEKIRMWRQHGMDLSTDERHGTSEAKQETYVNTAGNFRMTDLQAAVGIEQLARLDEIIRRRRAIAECYIEGMTGISGLTPPRDPEYARSNHQSFIVRLDDPEQVSFFRKSLLDKGIDTRPGIMCAHLEPPYRGAWPASCLPKSEAATASTVILPLYPMMEDAIVERVIDAVRFAMA
jgi:dTDP-4-amino-4,6-dideoxygalactose transaminase